MSHLAIFSCKVKKTPLSICTCQSVSFTRVLNQPTHQVLLSMLKTKENRLGLS